MDFSSNIIYVDKDAVKIYGGLRDITSLKGGIKNPRFKWKFLDIDQFWKLGVTKLLNGFYI